MYKKTEYRMPQSIEVEVTHKGRYGAPGMERGKRQKPTPEEVKRNNERQRLKRIRRKINMNFCQNDYHLVLTYRREERCTMEEAMIQIRKWLDRLRYYYKKAGEPLKYIAVVAIGERGAVHAHVILNGITDTPNLARKHWKKGRVHMTMLDDSGEYAQLAAYIMQQDTGQERMKYICSRNLKEPRPIKKDIKRFDPEKIRPYKGYYLDQDSIITGINPVTGYPYMQYTMKKVRLQI
jgi:hypothetical protein